MEKENIKLLNPVPRKTENVDLRGYYFLNLEMSMIVVLSLLIGIMHVPIRSKQKEYVFTKTQEVAVMEEIVQSRQETKIPPPLRPPVPVEVPSDVIIEDVEIDINAEWELGVLDDRLLMPPAQPENDSVFFEDEVFVVVEQMPELIGGLENLQKQIRYPEMAVRAGIEGRVFVQFVVDEKGNVTQAEVVRGIGGGCNEEALRVVQQAKFRPGLQRGRPVRVQYSIPINFKLIE